MLTNDTVFLKKRYLAAYQLWNFFLRVSYMLYYTIIDLCWGGHWVLLNSKRHIDRRGAEANMIKFTVQ